MPLVLAVTHLSALAFPVLFWFLPGAWALPASTGLSFLHFAATLVLFYGSPGWRQRHAGIGLILPLALVAGGSLWMLVHPESLSKALLFFFVFVLWHYCKQSYGLFVLSFRGQGGFDRFDSVERQAVLGFFLWTALFGFLSTQMQTSSQLTFGLYVPTLGLAHEPWEWIGRAGSLAGLGYCLYVCSRYRRYLPFATALAFWVWCDLRLFGFRFLVLLPAFHALQYFPIVVWRFSRRPGSASGWLLAACVCLAVALVALFHSLPRPFAWLVALLAASEIGLNLQHYFLDAYIWRARESSVRAELDLK